MRDPMSDWLDQEVARIRARKHQVLRPSKCKEAESDLVALRTLRKQQQGQTEGQASKWPHRSAVKTYGFKAHCNAR
jgi:hypothetical protein